MANTNIYNAVQSALEPMILSASGWRKVFAANGDEESKEGALSEADAILAAAMASVFSDFLKDKSEKENPIVTIAMDSRPTGPALAESMIKIFIAKGLIPQYHYISAAPEVMCWAGRSGATDGFAYISASHNPIGHNGVKFGLTSGGVIDGAQSSILIKRYKDVVASEESLYDIISLMENSDPEKLKTYKTEYPSWKKKSYENYKLFTKEVISGTSETEKQKELLKTISESAKDSPVGIIAEHNGSARSLSIDKEFLESLNIKVISLNDKPGQIVHRIVPEGHSLDLCREELEKAYQKDKAFQLGYVPDCDGDRGNLVYINKEGKAHILEAQEVFALSVLAELSYLKWCGDLEGKSAVSVNGPTSLRIEEIGEVFGTEVHRAEVGEANVVNLAASLRDKGYLVRILGEGSNGGNITYPAAVRDPLNTAGAILKLLSIKSKDGKPGLFEIWCQMSQQMEKFTNDCSLSDIIKTLPPYTTTSAFEDNAIMRIQSLSHGKLKSAYEENFPQQWQDQKEKLNQLLNIHSWEEINMEGIESKAGVGSQFRSGAEKGGLKIQFYDDKKKPVAYIWMRGSGTEPVFRVLADVKGNNKEAEEYLLSWQRQMIEMADK